MFYTVDWLSEQEWDFWLKFKTMFDQETVDSNALAVCKEIYPKAEYKLGGTFVNKTEG